MDLRNVTISLLKGFGISALTFLITGFIVFQLAYSDEPSNHNLWGNWSFVIIFTLPLIVSALYIVFRRKALMLSHLDYLAFFAAAIMAMPFMVFAVFFVAGVTDGL